MIIFNTTFHLEDDIHEKGLHFLKEVYIPRSREGGFLFEPRLSKIYSQHEESGVSYSLQFKVKNVDSLDYWLSSKEAKSLQTELSNQFGNRMLGFVTLMEEVDL